MNLLFADNEWWPVLASFSQRQRSGDVPAQGIKLNSHGPRTIGGRKYKQAEQLGKQ
jgi:hypothetical protein